MYNSYPNFQQPSFDPNVHNPMMYDNIQYERLMYEIKENRRRINNLLKRIVRIENYLRIKDTTDSDFDV